jgi:hypothetical protein
MWVCTTARRQWQAQQTVLRVEKDACVVGARQARSGSAELTTQNPNRSSHQLSTRTMAKEVGASAATISRI